jgi:endonuclease/exonuclease/phosphatase family metal-dependent hydrolase
METGGTLLGVTGNMVGRVKKHKIDKYGRWTHLELLGRDGRTVSVICAYQVVQEKGLHGSRTTYSQQVRMMRIEGVLDPNPRQAFIRDLKTMVTKLKNDDHDIILMGDFNELIGIRPNDMASVILAGKLSDVHSLRHGLDREKPTYARGTKRVDYILISERLTSYVRATGAEPFNFRIFSDHRGLFVDFALPGFFDRAPQCTRKSTDQRSHL